ncbi:hypothetical protein DB346_20515 [Verrucomicrobia bacterium LW23]|nr:hypothetical protein DB346_20515 [Verrucomicrobia bacterium LW23]
MSNLSPLSIQIKDEKRAYYPGDEITGTVIAKPQADTICRKLTIALNWRTGGMGNVDEGKPQGEITLFSGTLRAGVPQEFPFSLTVPPGPLTYHGNIVYVNWYLHAQADVPWAFDPTVRREFILASPQDPVPLDLGPSYKPPKHPSSNEPTPWWLIILLILAAAVATWFFPCCLFIIIPAVIFWAIPEYRKWLQVKKLGKRVLHIEPQQAYAGESIEVSFQYQATSRVDLEFISAELLGQERVESGSGSNRKTHKHKIFGNEEFLLRDAIVTPGIPGSHRATLWFPKDAAPTFAASNNWVEWSVIFRLKVRGYGVWEETHPVTLWPTPGVEHFKSHRDPDDFDEHEDTDDEDV